MQSEYITFSSVKQLSIDFFLVQINCKKTQTLEIARPHVEHESR